jgi:hypothetical protein
METNIELHRTVQWFLNAGPFTLSYNIIFCYDKSDFIHFLFHINYIKASFICIGCIKSNEMKRLLLIASS